MPPAAPGGCRWPSSRARLAGACRAQGAGESAALQRVLERWDLVFEAGIAAAVVEELFAVDLSASLGSATAAGRGLAAVAAAGIAGAERRSTPALAELAARPGLAAKASYLRALLLGSRRRRRLAGGLSQGRPRLAHLSRAVSRGWKKWVRSGLAASEVASVKRGVYERRRGRPG